MAGPTLPLSRFTRGNLRSYELLSPGRFPHLSPDDRKVWVSFLHAGVLSFRRAYYDVRLGARLEAAPACAPEDARLYEMLRCKRVDVVLEGDFGFLVCEVKPVCSMAALGQALVYGDLFKQEFSPRSCSVAGVVCEEVDPDVSATCRRHAVQIWTPAGRVV